VEIDPFCYRILRKHWPSVPRFRDVRDIEEGDLEPVDLICGGFPCQPTSHAGRRRGQQDQRWLWPEMARIVRMVRPQFILVENPTGLFTVNQGGAFARILGDLAAFGYDCEWDCLPAAVFGAPHLRYRVFIVAYSNAHGFEEQNLHIRPRGQDKAKVVTVGDSSDMAYAHRVRCEGATSIPIQSVQDKDRNAQKKDEGWQTIQQHRLNSNDSVVADSDKRRREEDQRHIFSWKPHSAGDVGVVANANKQGLQGFRIFTECPRKASAWARLEEETVAEVATDLCGVDDGDSYRVDRLKALGNAVIPQIAYWLGKRIIEAFNLTSEG